jgi:hypothetical protein
VEVGVGVAVLVEVAVGVLVEVGVNVLVGVGVGKRVPVGVGVAVGVAVGVGVGVLVKVAVGVGVTVLVGVGGTLLCSTMTPKGWAARMNAVPSQLVGISAISSILKCKASPGANPSKCWVWTSRPVSLSLYSTKTETQYSPEF